MTGQCPSCPYHLPTQVNATGVMPVIFASSLLAVPGALARYAQLPALDAAARSLSPGGPLYLPVSLGVFERRRQLQRGVSSLVAALCRLRTAPYALLAPN